MRPTGNVCVLLVDETVGQEKYPHTKVFCGHILANIVADHDTFFGSDSKPVCDLAVVAEIRLAVVAGFIRGDQLHACGIDARSEYLPEATLRLAELLLARGETKGADEQFRLAVERCAADGFQPLRIHAYAGLARTALAAGDKDAAARYFLTTCLLYHDETLVPPLAREAIPLLDELGRADEAQALRDMLRDEYP